MKLEIRSLSQRKLKQRVEHLPNRGTPYIPREGHVDILDIDGKTVIKQVPWNLDTDYIVIKKDNP